MKRVDREVVIPERKLTVTRYIAEDGSEFEHPNQCQKYERDQIIQQHRVYKRRIVANISSLPDEDANAVLYYLEDAADLDFLIEFIHPRTEEDEWRREYMKYGPGWYLHWYETGGDWPDHNYLVNAKSHINSVLDAATTWAESIEDLMNNANLGG